MKTLNIESNITYSDVEQARLITSNNFQSYNFIGASICFDFKIGDTVYSGTFQTAHTHHLNDYSLPSNSLTLYEGDDLLEKMEQAYESDIEEDSFIECLNEELELQYSKEEWSDIYAEYNELVIEAQAVVNCAESEADEELENDDGSYVMIVEMERIEVEEGIYKDQQCQESYSLRFESSDEAENEIRERQAQGDHAFMIEKEQGVSERHEHLSNF